MRRLVGAWLLASSVGLAAVWAQPIMVQPWGRWRVAPRIPTEDQFDGAFNFCRGMYRGGRGFGGGWATDYPAADHNFMTRLGELTRTIVSRDETGRPNYFVVRPTDDAIFRCPLVVMWEVGSVYFAEEDAVRLREYLLKGGFLWVDDFWGARAWAHWADEIAKVLPPDDYPIVQLPREHPIFHTLFDIAKVPQIPSINFWMGSGGGTSERGPDSAEPTLRGIVDDRGRLIVVMTHNTDIADSWEREGDDPTYFYTFSPDGYALAINILLYAMTH